MRFRLKRKDNRRLYQDLAWIFPIITPPEDYIEETQIYHQWITQHSQIPVQTLLHLGSGAGHHDFSLKKHFSITGIDLSPNMLELAKRLNPEVTYQKGDMRNIRLNTPFDVVACFDAIDYMTTEEDIRSVLTTVWQHLKPGGVFFMLIEQIKENFRQNKTVCTTHQKDNIQIVFIENHYDPEPEDSTYEVTMVYLIRENGELSVESDHHLCGLFDSENWETLFKETGFECVQKELKLKDHPDDVYPVFIGIKHLQS